METGKVFIDGGPTTDQVGRMQGMLYVKIPSRKLPGKFWVVALQFWGDDELTQLVVMADKRGWEPFSDVIDLKVNGVSLPEPPQEDGPGCPYHGEKNLRPSRKPGWLYCATQLKDGGWCKHTQRL